MDENQSENSESKFSALESFAASSKKQFSYEDALRYHKQTLDTAREIFFNILRVHDVKGQMRPMVGVYAGIEPSYLLTMNGTLRNMLGALAEWGKCHDQQIIKVAYRIVNAEGFRFIVEFSQSVINSDGRFIKFLEALDEEHIGITLRYNTHREVIGVEFWGKSDADDSIAKQIRLLLEQVIDVENIKSVLHEHDYLVLDIPDPTNPAKNYDYYINQSRPLRSSMVKRGDCLKRYNYSLEGTSFG